MPRVFHQTILAWCGLALALLLSVLNNASAAVYAVKMGDTVYRIAKNHGVTIDALRELNPTLKSSDGLKVGQVLTLPEVREKRTSASTPVVNTASSAGAWLAPLMGVITTPFLGVNSRHPGLDVAAPTGTPVRAARSGVVREAQFDERRGWGGTVVLDHGGGYTARYSHNSELLVKVGDTVEVGQVIAKVGSTGNSSGPHLDYRVYHNGKPVNPNTLR